MKDINLTLKINLIKHANRLKEEFLKWTKLI